MKTLLAEQWHTARSRTCTSCCRPSRTEGNRIVNRRYEADVNAILARRDQFGSDCWTTVDRRIGEGSPSEAMHCWLMLADPG